MEVAGRALLAFMANVCCQLVEGVVESGVLQKNNKRQWNLKDFIMLLLVGS